jgi:Fis family transcriptional regulator
MVLGEVEKPLLEVIMKHVKGNQSNAAKTLGLSRGTLRKKLKIYRMI